MTVAADYPFLEVFGTMILFFFWLCWFWLVVTILADIFRRHDASGWAKAGWILFVIAFPFIGVLVYVVAQTKAMNERMQIRPLPGHAGPEHE